MANVISFMCNVEKKDCNDLIKFKSNRDALIKNMSIIAFIRCCGCNKFHQIAYDTMMQKYYAVKKGNSVVLLKKINAPHSTFVYEIDKSKEGD